MRIRSSWACFRTRDTRPLNRTREPVFMMHEWSRTIDWPRVELDGLKCDQFHWGGRTLLPPLVVAHLRLDERCKTTDEEYPEHDVVRCFQDK